MKILIVDDDAQVLILKSILKREGFTHITTEQDPRRTAKVFATLQPDLLLLNLNMPHLSGFDVIESLESKLGEYFPILMLTADERATTKKQALTSGAKDFINKPSIRPK